MQVRHLDTSEKSELHKLQQLKDEQGWDDFPVVSNKKLIRWIFFPMKIFIEFTEHNPA